MGRLLALAAAAAGVAFALSGCVVVQPPIPDEVVEVALDGASVGLSLPPTAEVGDPSSREVLVAVVDADLAVVIVGRDVDAATFEAWAASASIR